MVSDSETKNSFGERDIRTAISIHLTSSPASIMQASCVGIAIQTELAQGSSRTHTTPYQPAISTITAGLACLGHIGLSGLNTAPWQGVDETGNTSKAHLGTGLGNICSRTLKVWGTQTSLNNYKQHLDKNLCSQRAKFNRGGKDA